MAENSLFITDSKNNTYEFPMTPVEFNTQGDSGNQTIDVINLGQINHLNLTRKLNALPLSLTIPVDLSTRQSYWTGKKLHSNSSTGGNDYITFLTNIFEAHEVIRVILSGTKFNNIYTIEKLNVGFKDADNSQWQVELELLEWRDYSPPIVKIVPPPAPLIQKHKYAAGQMIIISSFYDSSTAPTSQAHIPSSWMSPVLITAVSNDNVHNPYKLQWGSGSSTVSNHWCNDGDIRGLWSDKQKVLSSQPRVNPPAKIGLGSQVILNGRVFADSYGGGAGATFTNRKMQITLLASGRAKPYCVGPSKGQYTGWVAAGSVKLA